MARVINKQLQKTSGADVLLSRKKIRKTLGGGLAAAPPPPLVHVCPRVKVRLVFLKHYRKTVFDPRQEKNFFFIPNIGNKVSMKRPFVKTTEQLQCSKAGNFTPDSGYMILYFQGSVYQFTFWDRKKYSLGLIPKRGVSTSAWKSPLQWKECFWWWI